MVPPSPTPAPSPAELGRRAEDLVAAHYHRAGWAVLATRWSCPLGELDLVCRRSHPDPVLVFVEVKARRSPHGGDPRAALTPAKWARLRRAAGCWLAAHPAPVQAPPGRGPSSTPRSSWGAFRFDLAAVSWPAGSGRPRIEIIEGLA
jgi:putative endonuclease